MKNQKIFTAIAELREILADMKALLEWHKLKQFENSQQSVSNLKFHDNTLNDLNNTYSSFSMLSSQIHADLEHSNITRDKINNLKKELTKLELQAYYLGSGVRVY